MRHSSLSRDLELLLILSDARDYSVEDICDKLDISRRTLYYYIESFRRIGFNIFKRNGCYHVDQRSPFLRKLLVAAVCIAFTFSAVFLKRLFTLSPLDFPGMLLLIVFALTLYQMSAFYTVFAE